MYCKYKNRLSIAVASIQHVISYLETEFVLFQAVFESSVLLMG